MSVIDQQGNIHRGTGVGGGQFAGHARTAPTGVLEEPDTLAAAAAAAEEFGRAEAARWGELHVREGARTPWGVADWVTPIAPGVVSVSTPGHGGVKLSAERNAVIPAGLRNASGWYEEDCEAAIVVRQFPELFQRADRTIDAIRDDADGTVRNYFPDGWERATGRTLLPGQSTQRDEQTFRQAHETSFLGASASTAESDNTMVVVSARRASDGAQAEYLVSRDEYRAGHQITPFMRPFVIAPARHPQLPVMPTAAKAVPARHHKVPSAWDRQADKTLTPTARDRIARDLGKRWQSADGRVRSLQMLIEDEGITGRTAYQDSGGKRAYALLQATADGHNYSLQVSKATFDYFAAVPDSRKPSQIAQQDAYAYRERIDRQVGGPTRPEQEKADAMYTEYRRLADLEKAAHDAENGTWEQRDAARRILQAQREVAATITG